MSWDRARPNGRGYVNPKYRTKQHRDDRARHMAELERNGVGLCAEIICIKSTRTIHAGMKLHLCHDRATGQVLGLGHADCNRSEAGRYAARKANALAAAEAGTGNCSYCKREFARRNKTQRFCGPECRAQVTFRARPPAAPRPPKQPKAKPVPVQRECAMCGCLTMRPRYCSEDCCLEANARNNRNRYRVRQGLPVDDRPRKPRAPRTWDVEAA